MGCVAFDVEEGLIELAGTPSIWIWVFTCPIRECTCRFALVISACERSQLVERARSIADAYRNGGQYGDAAESIAGVTAFNVDLDSRELFPPVGDAPLDPNAHPEVKAVVDRLDDDVLDAIARIWHRGKGEEPPQGPDEQTTIELAGFHRGDFVAWDETRCALRADAYVFGGHIYVAVELYCVEPDCRCAEAIVDFTPLLPRGAPHPGHVEINGEKAALRPQHARHRARLTELWTSYCQRYVRHQERIAGRRAIMHALAGRIVAAPEPESDP